MLRGTNLTYTKAYNFRIVFDTIRIHNTISRADIARQTNLTAQTVSNIVNRLKDKNFVLEGEKSRNDLGAPSTRLRLNPDGAFSIGIDFNRDHLTAVLIDLTGNVRQKLFYEVDSPNPDNAIRLMVSAINQLSSNPEIKKSYFCGVGIGLPGPFDINGKDEISNTVNPREFPNWKYVPIRKMIQDEIKVPVFIHNNASVATIGERWYGVGKNYSNFLYAFLGMGLGGGLFINDTLHEGLTGNAGEIGYFPYRNMKSPLIESDKPHIGEHFNLIKLYDWLKKYNIKVSKPEDLEQLFIERNSTFMEWVDLAKRYLASIFILTEYVLDIKVIILGGRLPQVIVDDFVTDLPILMKKLRVDLKDSAPTFYCGTVGSDAVALGAATLPMFDLFGAQVEVLMKETTVRK